MCIRQGLFGRMWLISKIQTRIYMDVLLPHLPPTNPNKQGRASHCCCVGPRERDIYMFGGSGPCWGR